MIYTKEEAIAWRACANKFISLVHKYHYYNFYQQKKKKDHYYELVPAGTANSYGEYKQDADVDDPKVGSTCEWVGLSCQTHPDHHSPTEIVRKIN